MASALGPVAPIGFGATTSSARERCVPYVFPSRQIDGLPTQPNAI
jgi:hypothetical protein